jgi:hypothetical protein
MIDQTPLFLRHIARLERRRAEIEAISRRYTWARVVIFFAGGVLAWGIGQALGAAVGWMAAGVAAALFIIVVALQRRVDGWIRAMEVWRGLYAEKVARLALDWNALPLPAGAPHPADPALAFDLDLSGPRSLHHLLDTAVSKQGSARLGDWLTCPIPGVTAIGQRQAAVRELRTMHGFRNRLRLRFRLVSGEPLDGERLLAWLHAPAPEQALRRLLPWATMLALLNLALLGVWLVGAAGPFWLLSTLAYGGLYFSARGVVSEFLEAIWRLERELGKFSPLLDYLEHYRYRPGSAVQEACRPFWAAGQRPSRHLRRVQVVTALVGISANQFLGPIINFALPWDFWAAYLAMRRRQEMAERLPAWLEAFHTLEALVSLGEYAALHPECIFPDIAEGGAVLAAEGMGHPLLPAGRKVRNDLHFEQLGELYIITGSNMAGKSTFVRTLGVNLCLAYAGAPVDALRFESRPFRLYTCIRINDSLGDGFSYFYAEVRRLKGLLEALRDPAASLPLLYLIDEIFRGTNNRERLIGSQAFVRALIGQPGVGLIATHDLELAALAQEHAQAKNVHFSDQVLEGRLAFDYKLRPGVSPTTNALRIMAIEGLPIPNSE